MPWDVGSPVLVDGQDFIGAWRLAGGEAMREGDLNQVLDGQPVLVNGKLLVWDAGVTAVRVGLETQDALRAGTSVTVYEVPLPALETWTEFSAWITPPADQVWARPYAEIEGSGDVDFGRISTQRQKAGQVAGTDLAPGSVTNSWPTKFARGGTPITIPDAGAVGELLVDKTFTSKGGPLEVVLSFDTEISGSGPVDIVMYLDATYAGGSSPTGYFRIARIDTSTSSTVRYPITIHEPIGDPDDIVGDPIPAAGSHTVNIYVRNASGAAVEFNDGSLQIREYGNDAGEA